MVMEWRGRYYAGWEPRARIGSHAYVRVGFPHHNICMLLTDLEQALGLRPEDLARGTDLGLIARGFEQAPRGAL